MIRHRWVASSSVTLTVGLSALVVLIACSEALGASHPVAAGLLSWLGLLAVAVLAELRRSPPAVSTR